MTQSLKAQRQQDQHEIEKLQKEVEALRKMQAQPVIPRLPTDQPFNKPGGLNIPDDMMGALMAGQPDSKPKPQAKVGGMDLPGDIQGALLAG